MGINLLKSLSVALVICLSMACSATAASFTAIQLNPRADPTGFENGRRYEISYLQQAGESVTSLEEIDLPIEGKIEEMDFILAGVARELLDKEFSAKGFKGEISQVASATPEEILNLVKEPFVPNAKAWIPENQASLGNYMGNDPSSLFLFRMVVLVADPDGGTTEMTVPLLIRLKDCPAQRDLVTLFFVTTAKNGPSAETASPPLPLPAPLATDSSTLPTDVSPAIP